MTPRFVLRSSEALNGLAEDGRLVPWRSHLLDAGSRQAGIRRETEFRHGRLSEVVEVLDNGRLANVSDLASLTMTYVREIATEIRDGSTSDWRQYWSFDALNRRPERPKPENECRNALLSDLRHRLQRMGVNAWEEGRYANDTRADVTISFGGFEVPVETKRSCHRELWSGVRKQLIAKYSRDPGADGHGIYLVFWFGSTVHCRPTPGVGGTPISAHQLEKRLLEALSAAERRKILVCVIDVSIAD